MLWTPDRNFNNLGVQNWGTLGFTYQYLCLRNLFRFVHNVWYQSLDPAFSAFPGINPFKISLGTFGFTYQRLCLRNFSRWGKNVSHQSFDFFVVFPIFYRYPSAYVLMKHNFYVFTLYMYRVCSGDNLLYFTFRPLGVCGLHVVSGVLLGSCGTMHTYVSRCRHGRPSKI